ncbi:MAG: GGDEF domain-containing protein [Terricaulis sp.]
MPNELSRFRGASGVERAKEIIERMRAHEIPPTPANYEIWTAYVAGGRPELNSEVETRLATGAAFDDEFNAEVFERFFANTRLSVQMLETTKTLARDLDESVTTLRDGGAQAGSYATVLETAMGALSGESHVVVSQLKVATQSMVEHSAKMAEQLEASSRQVAQLKAALEAIKVESLTDGMTGLANRRMFDETLTRRMRDASEAGSDLCVVLFDADHFGRLNDNWGQSLGDQVIRYIGAVLQAHAQGDVLAARWGADDFALIMPRTNVNLAEGLAARVSRAVKSKQLAMKSTGDKIAAITVSAGVACFRDSESAESVIGRARACLLAAKSAGRDKIITDLQLRRMQAA